IKTVHITVLQATPTINWTPSMATITYGTALGSNQLNATATDPNTSATVAGTFAYSPPTGALLNAGSQLLSVNFTPSSSNYASNTGSTTITVNPAGTTTTLTRSPSSTTYGQSVTLTAQ